MKLTVRHSPYYPPDRCWIWEVTGGYGERWTGWRPTYPEAVELGLEDLLYRAGEAERMTRALTPGPAPVRGRPGRG